MNASIPLDSSVLLDMEENPYYKKIKQELRKKHDVAQKQAQLEASSSSEHSEKETVRSVMSSKERLHDETPARSKLDIEDKVSIKGVGWEGMGQEGHDDLDTSDYHKKVLTEFKANGLLVLRNLGLEIDFSKKISEMKQLYIESMIQSRSHNMFRSSFASFKVGVVGQILSWVGQSPEALRLLKQKALEEAFIENCHGMSENLYNMEVAELMYGRRKKSRKILKLLTQIQSQLVTGMTHLGRPEFWSKTRLLEEKTRQCQRIEQEFNEERKHLVYQYYYLLQAETQSYQKEG